MAKEKNTPNDPMAELDPVDTEKGIGKAEKKAKKNKQKRK